MTPEEYRALGERQVGKWYVFGAEGPDTFDCSGLVKFMLAHIGVRPDGRDAQSQHDYFADAAHGTPVPLDELRFADVCFYGQTTRDIHHVTIAWGGDRVLEAAFGSRSTTSVAIARRQGAKVAISDVRRHSHLLDAFRPKALPWRVTDGAAAARMAGEAV
jgi:cell wall-associated NlpC family hydrolase